MSQSWELQTTAVLLPTVLWAARVVLLVLPGPSRTAVDRLSWETVFPESEPQDTDNGSSVYPAAKVPLACRVIKSRVHVEEGHGRTPTGRRVPWESPLRQCVTSLLPVPWELP